MENNIFEGILLEDVVVAEVEEPKPEDPFDYVTTVIIGLVLPFVISIPASWWLGDNAGVVWFGCLAAGLYFLTRYFIKRQVSPIAAFVALVAYVPVMTFALMIVSTTVPTGFHIRE